MLTLVLVFRRGYLSWARLLLICVLLGLVPRGSVAAAEALGPSVVHLAASESMRHGARSQEVAKAEAATGAAIRVSVPQERRACGGAVACAPLPSGRYLYLEHEALLC